MDDKQHVKLQEELQSADLFRNTLISTIFQGVWITGVGIINEKMLEDCNKILGDINTKLREAITSKTQFLARCSHELRTPLNGIVGSIDLLTTADLNMEQIDLLSSAKECSLMLMNLINDILDFSKMEVGKLQLSYSTVDVRSIFKTNCRTI